MAWDKGWSWFCLLLLMNVYLLQYHLFFEDFIYSWETQRERQRHRQREKQAPCREPDVGLDPGFPGSCPGLKAVLNCWATRAALQYHLFFEDFIYSWDTQRKREAETQAEGEAGSMQGARHGTRSWVSRIRPWAEGRAKLLSHPGCPKNV